MQMVTTFPGGARVATEFGGFVVNTDQPLKAGGDDAYPTPFETFLASIGACAGAYVLAFCRQRGLPAHEIRILQSIDRDPETHLVWRIHLDIEVPAGFPEKYRAALIHVAGQCTVKKHLENPPRIEVAVRQPDEAAAHHDAA